MSRRKRKRQKQKLLNKPNGDGRVAYRYRNVLAWWIPMMALVLFFSYLHYADIKEHGDAAALTAELQPTTTSKMLGSGIFIMVVGCIIAVVQSIWIYRRKRQKRLSVDS